MRQSPGLFGPSEASFQFQFSADYTIGMFGFDFRQGQVRGIDVSHETIRRWVLKFGQEFANRARRRLPTPGDKWHMDEVAIAIGGTKHWLWRAVDQNGVELDILIQSRRNKAAAKRLLRKLIRKQMRTPRVMITDKIGSYAAAKREMMPGVEHR